MICVVCPEEFILERYTDEARPPFPQDWHLDVVHDHSSEPAIWKAVVYYRKKGQRYPAPVKYLAAMAKDNSKAVVAAKKMANDSRPGRRNR